MNTILERRRHQRFSLKAGALVEIDKPKAFGLGKPRFVELGSVANISMGGLAVLYADKNYDFGRSRNLSIKSLNDDLKIENILFQVVSDFKTISLPGSSSIKRCGLKFIELTDDQTSLLDSFIQDHRR